MENNLSSAAKSFTRPSVFKCFVFSAISSLLLIAANLPSLSLSIICFIIASAFLSAAISYRGNFVLVVTLLPAIAFSALFGNIVCVIYPIFASLVSVISLYSVRFFKEKKYTVIAGATVFSLFIISLAAFSMILSYGSLSSSAFSALNADAKGIWLDFINENSAILGKDFVAAGEDIYNTAITLILYFSVGFTIGSSVALSYLFTSLYYFFIKEEKEYRYFVEKEDSELNISVFGAFIFITSMFFTSFVSMINASAILSVVFVNLSLIYFPFFLVIGMKYIIAKLRAHRLPVFYLIILGVTLLISPIYPFILISLFGASDTVSLSIQRKIKKSIASGENDDETKNDQQ